MVQTFIMHIKRKQLLAAALISAVAGVAQAAGPTVSLVDPTKLLDLSNLTVGTTFSLSIIGTDFPATTGGALDISVDSQFLRIDSASYNTAAWESTFSSDGSGSADKSAWFGLEFGTSGIDPNKPTPTGTFTIGTITFTALKAGTTSPTLADSVASTSGGFVNDLGDPIAVIFNSTPIPLTIKSPAEVPVPAALWLLGSGLMGLVGWSRRRTA